MGSRNAGKPLTFWALWLLLPLICQAAGFLPEFQRPIGVNEAHSVPGNNTFLTFCDSPDKYILDVEFVDVYPADPKPGDNLSIKATGQLKESVVKGSKLLLQVALKKGSVLIPLIKLEQDLCNQLADMGEECPLDKGALNISKQIELPNSIPSSEYIATATAVTEDGENIVCFSADMHF